MFTVPLGRIGVLFLCSSVCERVTPRKVLSHCMCLLATATFFTFTVASESSACRTNNRSGGRDYIVTRYQPVTHCSCIKGAALFLFRRATARVKNKTVKQMICSANLKPAFLN